MLFLILALALLLASTARAAPVAFTISSSTSIFALTSEPMTAIISTPTSTPPQLATAWPTVQARQWESAPAWAEPAPVWSEPAAPVWTEPTNTWAPAPTTVVTSYSWADAISYSYTNTPTATNGPNAHSIPGERKAFTLTGGSVWAIIFGCMGGFAIIGCTFFCWYKRRSPKPSNRDSDVEMILRSTQPSTHSHTQSQSSINPSHTPRNSTQSDGFHPTPVRGHEYISTSTTTADPRAPPPFRHPVPRRPVPAYGLSLPEQPTHWPVGEVEQSAR